jgi:hypothetical protein
MPDKTLCEEAGVPEAANSLKAPVSCCTPRVHCHQCLSLVYPSPLPDKCAPVPVSVLAFAYM